MSFCWVVYLPLSRALNTYLRFDAFKAAFTWLSLLILSQASLTVFQAIYWGYFRLPCNVIPCILDVFPCILGNLSGCVDAVSSWIDVVTGCCSIITGSLQLLHAILMLIQSSIMLPWSYFSSSRMYHWWYRMKSSLKQRGWTSNVQHSIHEYLIQYPHK